MAAGSNPAGPTIHFQINALKTLVFKFLDEKSEISAPSNFVLLQRLKIALGLSSLIYKEERTAQILSAFAGKVLEWTY